MGLGVHDGAHEIGDVNVAVRVVMTSEQLIDVFVR